MDIANEHDIYYCDNLWIHISASFGMVSVHCLPHQLKKMVSKLTFFYAQENAKPTVDSTLSADWQNESEEIHLTKDHSTTLETDRSTETTYVNWFFSSHGMVLIIGMSGDEFLALCNKLLSEIDPSL